MATTTTTKTTTTIKKIVAYSLPKEIFNIKVNSQAIFDSIISERNSRRQGTHKVKNRAEVSGSNVKPWKQKGTGRARFGSRRNPIWVGGGRAFGPKPWKNYEVKVNKKVKRLAFLSALTLKAKSKKILIKKVELKEFSTKMMLKLIASWKLKTTKVKPNNKILIITSDQKIFKSVANLKYIKTSKLASMTVEKISNCDYLVLNQKDIANLVKIWGKS